MRGRGEASIGGSDGVDQGMVASIRWCVEVGRRLGGPRRGSARAEWCPNGSRRRSTRAGYRLFEGDVTFGDGRMRRRGIGTELRGGRTFRERVPAGVCGGGTSGRARGRVVRRVQRSARERPGRHVRGADAARRRPGGAVERYSAPSGRPRSPERARGGSGGMHGIRWGFPRVEAGGSSAPGEGQRGGRAPDRAVRWCHGPRGAVDLLSRRVYRRFFMDGIDVCGRLFQASLGTARKPGYNTGGSRGFPGRALSTSDETWLH
jgi:hypothetical protein